MNTIDSMPGIGLTAARANAPVPAEAVLVEQLGRGDERAFERLVRDHGGRLYAVARRILGNEEDARDAVQETFITAFRSIRTFRGHCRLSTWLHRVAVNTCLMQLRSQPRTREQSIEALLPTFDETGHHSAPVRRWQPDAEARMCSDELCAQVRRAIDELPGPYREALLLRDIEELSTEDAAQLLGVTPNALRIRIHRARQALRTKLDPLLAVASA